MRRAILIVAALWLIGPAVAAPVAGRASPDPAALAVSRPVAYAAYRGTRHPRRHGAYPVAWRGQVYLISWPWRITHPRLPACYRRPPYHCPAPHADVRIPVSALALEGLPTNREVAAPIYRRHTGRSRWHRHRLQRHRRAIRPAVRVRG